MAKKHGRLGTFGWNGTAVNGIVDSSVDISTEEVETTTHDSAGWKEFIAGYSEGTVDLSLLWDEADAAQSAMGADAFAKTPRAVYFRMDTGSGLHSYTGTALITKWTPKAPNSGPGDLSVSLRFTGAVVEATQ